MNENGEENGNGGQKPELTRREQEILACVAVGMRNGEIASRLHVAESTVKTHLTSAYLKLGVKNRTQAAIATLKLTPTKNRDTNLFRGKPKYLPCLLMRCHNPIKLSPFNLRFVGRFTGLNCYESRLYRGNGKNAIESRRRCVDSTGI